MGKALFIVMILYLWKYFKVRNEIDGQEKLSLGLVNNKDCLKTVCVTGFKGY